MFVIKSLSLAARNRGRSNPLGRIAAATAAAGAVVAVAAGAGHTPSDTDAPRVEAAGHTVSAAAPAATAATPHEDPAVVAARNADNAARAAENAAREAEAHRPKVVVPVAGQVSSLFGARWGEMHAGMDFADPIGTPIAAVTDGTVIEAGPASGFGLWVRVQQDDGTVGVFGHVNDILVTVGQQVRAGDIIATVGNRGQSTGPHLHYEVWQADGQKIDPLPWLIARGLHLDTAMAS